MGKRLRQQRMGKGSPTFRNRGHLHIAPARYPSLSDKTYRGRVVELIHDPGRYVPLARIVSEEGLEFFIPAAEGMYVGQIIEIGPEAKPEYGNILPAGKVPEGTAVYNIEVVPGDGGKLARQAGSYAMILGKEGGKVRIRLPSGKEKVVPETARVTIGIPAGAGRIEKPLLKAGNAYHKWKVKARKWPRVRGVAMNVVNHPFGGGSHQRKGHPSTVARETPPGRKVGHIAARRTGRRKK